VAKEKGQPWTMAKSFIGSCPISHWTSYVDDEWFEGLEFELQVNSQVRQKGSVSDMIFKPKELLETIKNHFPLKKGDIVLTGTPEGVGPIKSGDEIRGEISGLLQWEWQVI
jgi:2-keto-4-pentenoate hydratase/2-oxohepta-3-ene-1,7-dioic acid hydratase in catechol pathway